MARENVEEYLMASISNTYKDDEDDEVASIDMEFQKTLSLSTTLKHSGEYNERRVIQRNRDEAHLRLWHDYFTEECVYNDKNFRRRFRMTGQLFDRILHVVMKHDDYFVQKPDAVGKMSLSSLQKVVAALRMLAYGAAADVFDEYIRIGETTIIQNVKRFAYAIVRVFRQQYCRSPTAEDVKRMQEQISRRGFPGMIGSIDCMHWEWKNFPHAWKGQ